MSQMKIAKEYAKLWTWFLFLKYELNRRNAYSRASSTNRMQVYWKNETNQKKNTHTQISKAGKKLYVSIERNLGLEEKKLPIFPLEFAYFHSNSVYSIVFVYLFMHIWIEKFHLVCLFIWDPPKIAINLKQKRTSSKRF